MSSRVTIGFQERATSFDVVLGPVLQRRDVDKDISAMAMRRHRHGPPGTTAESTIDTLQPCVLGGLDVVIGSGSTLRVHPGRAVVTNPARQTLTRPAGWSGRVDSDDYTLTRAELTSLTSVTPSLPLGSALLAREWWLVSAGMTEKTIETTSQLETLSASGGWDTSTGPKVRQHVLVPQVTRGTPGGPVPDLPAGHIALAWVMVPAGATNLSSAVIFDTRRLARDEGPNVVEGRWELEATGVGPALLSAVRATLGGERLEATISLRRSVAQLLEPGATWDTAASASAPKTAWIYLCKPRGVVPRPTRRGAYAFGAHPDYSDFDGAVTITGAVVISPKPPRIGGYDTSGRWDLRASAPLALSDVPGGSGYPMYAYAGMGADADDAICVGFVRYIGASGGVPVFEDAVSYCDDGWHSGEGISRAGDGSSPWSGVASASAGGGSDTRLSVTINRGSVGARRFPIDAARVQVTATTSELAIQCGWEGRMIGIVDVPILEGGGMAPTIRRIVEGTLGGIESTSRLIAAVHVPSVATFLTRASQLLAVRLPYGVPLVT